RFSLTRESLVGYNNRIASLEWNRQIGSSHSATLSLANSRYAFDLGYDGEGNTDFDFGYSVEETELKAWDRFIYNDDHHFTFGLAAKYYRVNPGEVGPSGSDSDVEARSLAREQAVEAGLFFSDRISLGERLEIEAGLRWSLYGALGPSTQREYPPGQPRSPGTASDTLSFSAGEFVKVYNGPEIRASARYLLGPELSLRAGYNSMYQYIHTLSNTTTVSPIDTWKLSDYNIRPQRSRQVSLGLFKNVDEASYELSLEGYYKWSEDVLDFKSGARLLLNEQVETEVIQGDGRAYGLEFLIRKNQGRLNGWLGYTWSRSQIRFDSPYPTEQINGGAFFPSNYDRPHDLSLVANYQFTRRYSLSMNFAYQTGRPITYPIGQFVYNNAEYVLYSDRNRYRIPDYIRLDLGVNIEGNHKKEKLAHSFWTVSVYNVLGRTNPYSVYFVTEAGEVKALQSSIFAVPIPSITYNFKF
ncbi:MAG TPA: TonB-dependent receptor, partial [Robiginitalea sp.]|nr:TonB-dependent receptor [Robiginitalea sp.]